MPVEGAFSSPFVPSKAYISKQSLFLSLDRIAVRPQKLVASRSFRSGAVNICCKASSSEPFFEPSEGLPQESIPNQKRLPFVSLIYDLATRSFPTVRNGKRYGDVYNTTLFGRTRTIITDLEVITNAYKNAELFSSSDSNAPVLVKLFGKKVMIAIDGEEHMKQRSMVQPAFSPQIFSLYFENVSRGAIQLWEAVENLLRDNKSIILAELIKKHYLRIIISVTTGRKLSDNLLSDPEIEPLSESFLKLTGAFMWPDWTPAYKAALEARDELLSAFVSIIRDRIKTSADVIRELREAGDRLITLAKQRLKSGNMDILTVVIASSSLPLSSPETLDESDLRDIGYLMILLWFAGYTTQTSTTLSAILEMYLNSDIRNRLIAEQEEIVVRAENRAVTYKQVTQEMQLLDSYISEILRFYPAAPILSRKLQADANICGYNLKKGSIVSFDVWSAQRDEKYYEQPQEIKPDRFLGQKHPYAHEIITFGAPGGPHYCAGAALARMTMKTTLSTLLRYFDLELDRYQTRKHVIMPEVQPLTGVEVVSCTRRQV